MATKRMPDPVRVAEREVLEAVITACVGVAEWGQDQAGLDISVRRAGATYLRALFRARGRIKAPRRSKR